MSIPTFQFDSNMSKLETFEWDDVWFEHTENLAAKRILYIGDSISRATRHIATDYSKNKILFDGFATSKALDNPYFKDLLSIFIKQESKFDALLFNNGLHGFHLSVEDYEDEYRKMISFLSASVDVPIFIVLTTHLPLDDERNNIVLARNEIALKIAAEYNLEVIDLYSVSRENASMYSDDNVHLLKDGYLELAKCILKKLNETIFEFIK